MLQNFMNLSERLDSGKQKLIISNQPKKTLNKNKISQQVNGFIYSPIPHAAKSLRH